MAEFKEVKDSGKRQEFSTGSRRDTDEGKGQPHLIAGEPFVHIIEKYGEIIPAEFHVVHPLKCSLKELLSYTRLVEHRESNDVCLERAIIYTMVALSNDEEPGIYSFKHVLRRLAIHYQNGAKKYSKNNWRKGQPVSRYYDSAMRHLACAMQGLKDEDHLSALLWNLCGIVQMKIDVKSGILPLEINDFPFTIQDVFKE